MKLIVHQLIQLSKKLCKLRKFMINKTYSNKMLFKYHPKEIAVPYREICRDKDEFYKKSV